MGLTKAMARELGPNIHVNGICPGAILTAMLESIGGEKAAEELGMTAMSPLKRVGKGSEIASTILFLATDESSYIDGQLIRFRVSFLSVCCSAVLLQQMRAELLAA